MGAAQPVCAALQSRSFLARTRLPPLHSSAEPCSPTEAEKSIVVLPGQPEASPASHPSCHEDHFQILTPSCCRWAPSVATTLLPCPCSSLPPAPATPWHMQPPSSQFFQGKTHWVVLQPHPCCWLLPLTRPLPPAPRLLHPFGQTAPPVPQAHSETSARPPARSHLSQPGVICKCHRQLPFHHGPANGNAKEEQTPD